MSTLKTTNLQHPSASDVGITLGSDGSVVLPQGFSGGIGSNVVQTVKTDTFTTTSATYTAITGLTATITPTSDTSKILIIADLKLSVIGNVQGAHARLMRDSTVVYVGDASGSRVQSSATVQTTDATAADFIISGNTVVFLDSPGTDSATTYSFQLRRGNAGTAVLNRSGNFPDDARVGLPASSITLIEVAA